jgi:pimeloyl-ACP methyl ester carboxylesterase
MHQVAALGEDKLAEIPFELLRPTLQSLQASAKVAWNPYLHNPKLVRRLGRISAPTLVIHGGVDRLIPKIHAETYAASIPGARLIEVADGGHEVVVEQPEAVVTLVRQHLSSSLA